MFFKALMRPILINYIFYKICHFAAVMDVVSSEARSGLPFELLYADDLVIMAPTMKHLGRRVADWSLVIVLLLDELNSFSNFNKFGIV